MSKDLRVVLLGKTGVGKSSTGNTIVGREAFRIGRGLLSGTERCQWADEHVGGVYLQVTDTPGLCDTHREEKDILKEVGKSVAVACPGPHVVLMVIRGDTRFTQEEWQAYLTLKKLFGEGIKDHVIVVFVGIDAYGDTLQAQQEALEREMQKSTGNIAIVLQDVSNRFFGINNQATKADREKQAAELLRMMQDLVKKNGGKYFSSKLSDEVSKLVQPLVDNKMKQGGFDRSQAERQINEDIVNDKVEPGFVEKLLDVVSNTIIPVLKVVGTAVCEGIKMYSEAKDLKQCSLM